MKPDTSRGAAIAELFRSGFAALSELEKVAPGDVDIIVAAVVAHVRAFRPEAVAPLGVLAAPTEPIRDPRAA